MEPMNQRIYPFMCVVIGVSSFATIKGHKTSCTSLSIKILYYTTDSYLFSFDHDC